jgi:DNA-binding MarR family transcriptional regulator
MPAVAASADTERTSSEDLLAALAGIRRATRRHKGRPAELSSLTTAQLELARVVRRNPGISVAGAAESMSLAPNTVSTLVRDLVAAGLLHRRTDPSDRRVGRLELTPTWKRKIDAWRDRRVTVVAEALRRLPTADRSLLEGALPALARLAGELEQ